MSKYNFSKIVNIGTSKAEGFSIYAKIEYKDGKLSITGVEGAMRNGNAKGGAGQIIMSYKEYDNRGYKSLSDIEPGNIGDASTVKKFFDVWDRWHLNDMKAGSKVQEDWLRKNPLGSYSYELVSAMLEQAGLNPDSDGYKYGHAWKKEEVPYTVWAWLYRLPYATTKPAWI